MAALGAPAVVGRFVPSKVTGTAVAGGKPRGGWRGAVRRTAAWALLAVAAGAFASDAGDELAAECDECHGEGGRSTDPDVPSIGGFSDFAILDLLESYRSGFRQGRKAKRPDGRETDMAEIASGLSEDELAAVAAHYAARQWQPHKQPFDAPLARRGARVHAVKCGKCHLRGGSVAESDLAITAGQWRTYLAAQFQAFDDGTRRMAPKMRKRYESLSDGDKRAILELYVSAGEF